MRNARTLSNKCRFVWAMRAMNCLSVRLSHPGTVSERLIISNIFSRIILHLSESMWPHTETVRNQYIHLAVSLRRVWSLLNLEFNSRLLQYISTAKLQKKFRYRFAIAVSM